MRKRTIKDSYEYSRLFEPESQVFMNELFRRIGIKKLFLNKKVLDVGCGIGVEASLLSKFSNKTIGVDIDKHKEWENFKNEKVRFQKGSSTKLEFEKNTFDEAYLKDLLHHIKGEGVEKTIKELKRVVKPGGSIVIIEGNRYNPLFYFYVTKIRGHDHFTKKDFTNLVKNNFKNYELLSLEIYPPFFFPMRVYRFILKLGEKVERLSILSNFFAYNIAIVKNSK